MPVYVHLIDHPDARVRVDTGMKELHPLLADAAAARWSSAATWPCGSASSTSRPPKAERSCLPSTPSWSGSRTSTSRIDPPPYESGAPSELLSAPRKRQNQPQPIFSFQSGMLLPRVRSRSSSWSKLSGFHPVAPDDIAASRATFDG